MEQENAMSTHRVLTPVLLLVCTLTACTATPPRTATTSAPRVYVTGSLTASPGPNPALQVVTEDDLMLTGRMQMGPAVRMLVPSIQ
jgi:hypothetical protein